jgi:hypothetical protein
LMLLLSDRIVEIWTACRTAKHVYLTSYK